MTTPIGGGQPPIYPKHLGQETPSWMVEWEGLATQVIDQIENYGMNGRKGYVKDVVKDITSLIQQLEQADPPVGGKFSNAITSLNNALVAVKSNNPAVAVTDMWNAIGQVMQ